MKTRTISIIAAFGLLPITGFAQTPPAPPAPPTQPVQPVPSIQLKDKDKEDKTPKVPVTFLGVETSSVPRVVSEQLNLPKGFGLVVDYVVPDGPAAAAGVQQNDILKMLNDQILMEPDQLSKLVRSYQEGTNVTLTILRKNAETKITVKLGKKEIRARMFDKHRPGHDDFGMMDFNDLKELKDLKDLGQDFKFEFGDMNFGPDIRETVRNAQREAMRASRDAQREARRAAAEARRSAREMRVFSRDKGTMKSTTIDLGKATIVFTDPQGEMKIENVNGKKVLTAKDPQGRLLFSGPVETQEELDKLPPEVRQRYDKLEQKDLPSLDPNQFVDKDDDADEVDEADDNDENDNDEDNSNTDVSNAALQQVSLQAFPRSVYALNIVLI